LQQKNWFESLEMELLKIKIFKNLKNLMMILKQGSAEKESRKIYFFEKSHDFHGKLDFLNFGKSKM
jgi:hypothetical protein